MTSTNQTNAVDDVIAQAKAQAAQATANAPVVANQTQGAVAAYRPAAPQTLDDLTSNGLSADKFLKVNQSGLMVKGKENQLIDAITGTIDMSKIAISQTLRLGANPAQYFKSYDGGVTASNGQPWDQVVEKAQKLDPKAAPYQSADILFVASEDVKDVRGTVVEKEGTEFGISTSVTNLRNVIALRDDVKKLGLEGQVVKVKITYEPKSKNGNNWGLFKFEVLGAAE